MSELSTIKDIAGRELHENLRSAAMLPTACQRFVHSHLAHVRHEFRIQHLILSSVRTDQQQHNRDPGYWIERLYAEVHCSTAPYIMTILNSIPHAVQAAISAAKKPPSMKN